MLFSGFVALLGMVVIGQAVSRRFQVEAAANETWAALGATRPPARRWPTWSKVALAVAAGVHGGDRGLAIALSPVGPVGVVRIAEPDPGVHVDALVLGLGALGIVVIGLLAAAVPAWRWDGRYRARRAHPPPITRGHGHERGGWIRRRRRRPALRARAPVGPGRRPGRADPGRRSDGGRPGDRSRRVLGVPRPPHRHAAVVRICVGLAGRARQPEQPQRLRRRVADQHEQDPSRNSSAVADGSGQVAASAIVPIGEVRSGSVSIPAIGFARRKGDVRADDRRGRAPRSAHEVALGSTTIARLHTGVGQTVRMTRVEGKGTTMVSVVGRAVLPGLTPYPGSDKAGLGTGALFTVAGWRAFSQDFQKEEYVFRWVDGGSAHTLTHVFASEDAEPAPALAQCGEPPAWHRRARAAPAVDSDASGVARGRPARRRRGECVDRDDPAAPSATSPCCARSGRRPVSWCAPCCGRRRRSVSSRSSSACQSASWWAGSAGTCSPTGWARSPCPRCR